MTLLFKKTLGKFGSDKDRVIKIKPMSFAEEKKQKDTPPTYDKNSSINEELQQMQHELKQVQLQKAILIDQVKQEIIEAKREWETEKEALIKAAENEGYTVGFETGKQEAMEKYKDMLVQAQSIVSLATEDYQQKLENADKDILALSVHIAKKIIYKELESHPDTFMPLVSNVIREVKDQPNLSIYLPPDQYETVLHEQEELKQVIGKQADLAIFVDYKLQTGSCIIEYPSGRIDASIDTQLNEIKTRLQELFSENA